MKPSVTFTFLGLFIIVTIAFYYLVPTEQAIQKEEQQEKSMTLLDISDDDEVNLIQIQNIEDNESIMMKKDDDVWTIKFPITASADNFMVEGLLAALTVSKKARRLEREGGWEQYGLEKPNLKIGIETKKGTSRRYLLLGDQAPLGDLVFAKWEDEDDYFLLDQNIKKAFNRSVYSLRLKQVFPTTIKDMVKIRFRTEREEFELSRHNDKWFWMEPIPLLGEVIEKEYVDEILTKLRDLYVKDFMDAESRTRRQLGFKTMGPLIKVWSSEDEKPDVLLIGGDVEARDALYGRMDEEESYFTVAKSNVTTLFHTIQDLARRFSNQELSAGNVLG